MTFNALSLSVIFAVYVFLTLSKQILLSIALLGFSLTVLTEAQDKADKSAVEGASTNIENEEETADADDPFRIKREGHGSSGFSNILSSVFNKKLGLIGSLSSISSSSSSKNADSHHTTYEYAPAPVKPFDWLGFKKTILSSLLQAVKAITGGVIALNGQLVKVKGHLLAAKAHLLSTKGDSITAFGRHIVNHAFTTPHDTAHTDIHEPSAPSASAPSGFGGSGPAALEHGYPSHQFKSGIEHPIGYYRDASGYAKRAAPMYYVLPQDDTSARSE